MKKLAIILLLLMPTLLMAESREEMEANKSEFRLTIGDMFFETLIWYDHPHTNYTGAGTPTTEFTEDHKFAWTPHFGIEYQYRVNWWCGIGMLVDGQYTGWQRVRYNNQNVETYRTKENFYNLAVIPTVRFTFMHTQHVNLYAGLGVGVDINGGSETDLKGKHTAAGAAVNITALGIRAGNGHWYGSAELGGLYALKNMNAIYMVSSRILTVGVGYTF